MYRHSEVDTGCCWGLQGKVRPAGSAAGVIQEGNLLAPCLQIGTDPCCCACDILNLEL